MNEENPITPPTPPVPPVPPISPTPPVINNIPASPAPIAPIATPAPVVAPTVAASVVGSIDNRDKVFAALSYVSFLFLIPLIGRHKEAEVMFHAKQGMVLFVAEVVVWFVLFVLEMLLIGRFSGLGTLIFYGIAGLFWLISIILSLVGIYYVFQGKRWIMPLLGKIAAKLQV